MTPGESWLRDAARLVIWYPFRLLVRILPTSWSFMLFRLFGVIHFFLGKRRVAQLERNLGAVPADQLAPADRRGVVLRYLMNHYIDRLHIFLYPRWHDPRRALRYLAIQGLGHVTEGLARGKGVIIVHPHFGPIQMKLFALAAHGCKLVQIGYPAANALSGIGRRVSFRQRLKLEALLPAAIHPADRFMRPVMRRLSDQGVVLVTGDGAGGGDRFGRVRVMPFLDGAMAFPEGAYRLARLTGATLLPAFIIPERTGYYKLVIGRPLMNGDDGATNREPHEAMQCFVRDLERFIYRYPYFWHFWDEWEAGKRKMTLTNAGPTEGKHDITELTDMGGKDEEQSRGQSTH